MPTDLKNPCQAVAKLIDVVNQGKQISESDLRILRKHLTVFSGCQALLNKQGERIVRGETTFEINREPSKKITYH
jgi:hypothetical protein